MFDGDSDALPCFKPDLLDPSSGELHPRVERRFGSKVLRLDPVALETPRLLTFSLSKKRYAAIVSPQPRHAFGTLAVGSAVNRSIKILARLFRRASPRSSFANSVSVQQPGAVANSFHAKDESKPETAKVYKGRGKSLNVNEFFEGGRRLLRLV